MDRRSWSTGDLAAAMGHPKDEALIGKLHKYLQGRVENPRGPLMGEIAAAFDMSETELRLGDGRRRQESDQIDQPSEAPALIREYDLRAGMGGGGFPDRAIVLHGNISDPVKPDRWQFPQGFIRQDLRAPQDRLLIVETQGDSMVPTISPGERVIVDTSHTMPSPDGIYAIRDRYGAIQVKRLQSMRRGDPPVIKIISDNVSHPAEDVGADEIAIVGRVICGFKRY